MSKSKINVIIGVLIGALTGFVLGAAFGSPSAALRATVRNKGNVSELSKFRHQGKVAADEQEKAAEDTLKYIVIDESGENWNVTMTKNK